MMQLLEERAALLGLRPMDLLRRDAPGGLMPPSAVSANGQCHLLRTQNGWVALNLPREDDHDVVPALTGSVTGWDPIADAALNLPAEEFCHRCIELQLAVAIVGETRPVSLAEARVDHVPQRVIDLSALWAGPLCAGLLARAGADVVRIESTGRPDPTAQGSPMLDGWLNGRKRRLPLDLRTEEGRAALLRQLERADVLVTSARALALERLGLTPDRLADLTWVAITAHGFASARVGFGDDCAAAGNLLDWSSEAPTFMGDALADPLTGFEAALAVLQGRRGFIDVAMASVAAGYAQV